MYLLTFSHILCDLLFHQPNDGGLNRFIHKLMEAALSHLQRLHMASKNGYKLPEWNKVMTQVWVQLAKESNTSIQETGSNQIKEGWLNTGLLLGNIKESKNWKAAIRSIGSANTLAAAPGPSADTGLTDNDICAVLDLATIVDQERAMIKSAKLNTSMDLVNFCQLCPETIQNSKVTDCV
jgi:hypothetical protein